MGPIRSRIISVFLLVRSSRVHFVENCGELHVRSHERARKSERRFEENREKGEPRQRKAGGVRGGPPLAVQNAGVLSNPVGASHPSRRCTMQKKPGRNPGFLFEFGGERGLDSLRSPYGPPLAVQNAGVLSNPVEASHPSRRCAMQKKKAWTRIQAFSLNLAVREGFEPSIHFRVYTLSRRAPSATQTPHRFVADNALRCRRALM